MRRKTLADARTISGIGLFTGADTACKIRPGSDAIAFTRNGVRIPAIASSLTDIPPHPALAGASRCTSLAGDAVNVFTVEHILSALAGLGITDAEIELDADELPIGDGSANLFTDPIRDAGTREIPGTIEPLQIAERVHVEDERGGSITAEPADETTYIYEFDAGPASPVPPQSASWSSDPDEYAREIAPARTFSLEHEARAMRSFGLFTRFTPSDLLVVGPSGPVENEWRFDNEPARHKLLDLIGDLALAGRPIIGRITSRRSGHALNQRLARALAAMR